MKSSRINEEWSCYGHKETEFKQEILVRVCFGLGGGCGEGKDDFKQMLWMVVVK